jgi:exodeoxyribonuclease-3
MKIFSWNVNGLRAVMNKGFVKLINTYQPDIVGLQETKLQESQIPNDIASLTDYHKYWSFADRKGYSGTCLLTKIKPLSVSYGIGDDFFDGEGRIIQAEYENFTLFNIYFPNGQMNDSRLEYKLKFFDQFLIHAESIRQANKNILIIGDFNTAHKPIDLAHPKANEKYSGFLPVERKWIDDFINHGYIDTFRHFDQGPYNYSWWTYRLGAREKNIGWRIDYCFVNKEIIHKVKDAFILKEVMGSDHCPVGLYLDLDEI